MKIEDIKPEVANDIKERPEIIVLIGVPASGKSTWTRKHRAASSKSYVVVSSDDVLERLGAEQGLNYAQAWEKFMGFADKEAKATFKHAVDNRLNIIYDRTNLSAKNRRGILQQLPKDYIKVAVVFQTEDKEVARRLEAREKETGKHIPPMVMKDMYSRYQSPTREEGFDQIIKA